jgi:hypothetical protein
MGSENEIQNSIIEYLQWKKITCWRNQSIGVYDVKNKSFRRLPKYAISGVSDILGILPSGRFLAIEVKSKTGTLSQNQKDFIKNINDNKGLAFMARSIDDVEAIFKTVDNSSCLKK